MDRRAAGHGRLLTRFGWLLLAALVVTAISVAMPNARGSTSSNLRADSPGIVGSQMPDEAPAARYQTPDEALATDLALIAQAAGWTAAEAAAYARTEETIDRIAVRLATDRPDVFVGSALASDPGGAPRLFVKGPADPELIAAIRSADLPIEVVDGQPYSLSELEARKTAVHAMLLAAGYREVVTTFDLTRSGLIEVTVRRQSNLPGDPLSVLALLPTDLRSGVEVTVGDVPIVTPTGAFGGMWLRRDDGSRYCTSGWSVRHPDGRTGVTGAGHCSRITSIEHPGHGIHTVNWQAQHVGEWGDVEWYTSAELEPPYFYADAATVRDVRAVEQRAAISVGEYVCVYGRASNARNCSMKVRDVALACGQLNRLVRMDGGFVIGGDSGGGWSYGNVAYGATFGSCDGLDSWSVADLFDEALGARVVTVDPTK